MNCLITEIMHGQQNIKIWLIICREIIIITIHKTHLKTMCANLWHYWSSSKSTQTISIIVVFKMLIIIFAGKACDAYRQELKRRFSVEWWELWIAAPATCYVYCAGRDEAQHQSRMWHSKVPIKRQLYRVTADTCQYTAHCKIWPGDFTFIELV